jgi:hypothetical protein
MITSDRHYFDNFHKKDTPNFFEYHLFKHKECIVNNEIKKN